MCIICKKKRAATLKIILNMLGRIFTSNYYNNLVTLSWLVSKDSKYKPSIVKECINPKSVIFEVSILGFRQLYDRSIPLLSLCTLGKGLSILDTPNTTQYQNQLAIPLNEKRSTFTFQGSWNRFGSSENIFLRKGTFTSFITRLNTKFVWCWLTESLYFVCMTRSSV